MPRVMLCSPAPCFNAGWHECLLVSVCCLRVFVGILILAWKDLVHLVLMVVQNLLRQMSHA